MYFFPLSCSVDIGSPAQEAGLHIGDQVMDVNGHSFVSIVHQEAVHILRSYQTLILTIKVVYILITLHTSSLLLFSALS